MGLALAHGMARTGLYRSIVAFGITLGAGAPVAGCNLYFVDPHDPPPPDAFVPHDCGWGIIDAALPPDAWPTIADAPVPDAATPDAATHLEPS
jgi:hypothetical protein